MTDNRHFELTPRSEKLTEVIKRFFVSHRRLKLRELLDEFEESMRPVLLGVTEDLLRQLFWRNNISMLVATGQY